MGYLGRPVHFEVPSEGIVVGRVLQSYEVLALAEIPLCLPVKLGIAIQCEFLSKRREHSAARAL